MTKSISRRTFLGLSGSAAMWYLTRRMSPPRFRAADRPTEWAPNTDNTVEWRYVAGRITDGGEDYGFVVSISALNLVTPPYQLLVQRKSLDGSQEFAEAVYETNIPPYDSDTGTYTFEDLNQGILATWQWDEPAGVYKLTVNTPELTLTDIVLKPQGDLIAEGGDGDITAGQINGILIGSDYHAEWTVVEIDDIEKGVARIDMQGLRPAGFVDDDGEYAHHWFAIAAEVAGSERVWISMWRIEYFDTPFWTVTLRGKFEASLTEESGTIPLTVEILEWQDIPSDNDPRQTGSRWRVTAPNDLLDLEIAVPPGQFITGASLNGVGGPSQMQEAIGTKVSGTVMGEAITAVSLVVAESTAEFYRTFLPSIQK